jgi:hypothetical protein
MTIIEQWKFLDELRMTDVLFFASLAVMFWLKVPEIVALVVTIWYATGRLGVLIAQAIQHTTDRILEQLKQNQEGAL